MDNYEYKYLKYKKKYIELKYGGGDKCNKSSSSRINPDKHSQLESMRIKTDLKRKNLEESKKMSEYDPLREPSWCDRILYRISDPDIKINPIQYNSYANDIIITSDHDLVWGIFTIDILLTTIHILVITWNQANQNSKIDDILNSKFFSQMNSRYHNLKSFDIICIAQQESNMYDTFLNIFDTVDSLQRSIINKYRREMTDTYIIQHTKEGVPKFYVRQTILIKKSILDPNSKVRIHTQCLKSLCSKSICGIGNTFKINDKVFDLNFFAVHMPVAPADYDLGLQLRIDAYTSIDNFIEKYFRLEDRPSQIDFIAGDLNFRSNVGSIAGDQLDIIRSKNGWKGQTAFEEFNEGDRLFGPTCKFNLPCKKN